ncbi:MAG: transglutaminase family protein [Chloroflexi bacterium]|nr:MAG: transglutaminase family protein [Chloroflexota bacterium]
MSRAAAAARGGSARDVLPSQQGAGGGHGRRRSRDAAAVKLEIMHSTRYRYAGPIAETVMEVRLRPMDGNGQRCLDFKLELSHGVKARAYVDGFGNHVHYFNLVRPHSGLSVISRSTVETGLDPDAEPGEELVQDFLRFRSPVKEVDGVVELARRHAIADPASAESVEGALDELALTISREFTYDRTVTNVYSSVDEVLELRAGVCQDFAHLFIAASRTMGVPARYVSGYIHSPGEKIITASHAWAEAWVEGRGWIGFDATHPVRTTPHHVRLAVGRDYTDAAPTRGVYVGSATGTMSISVKTHSVG